MTEKIIKEDTRKYTFKKDLFKNLTNGQIFMDKNGGLFIKSSYCDLIDKYATSLSDGDYKLFSDCEVIYPIDCNIVFRKILQEASDND